MTLDRTKIKKFAAFFLPLLLIIGSICFVEPSPEFKYFYIKDDCSCQPKWIYKKLYVDTNKTDVAFFGSSHTLRAINDSLLGATDETINVANYGYCRFGRDIQYELFRQAIYKKKLKIAFFEVTETEPSYSHPVYSYMGESSDIFIPAFIYNQDFYKNRSDAFIFRLAYLKSKFSKVSISFSLDSLKPFGFINYNEAADSSYLKQQKMEKLKDLIDYDPSSLSRKIQLSFSSSYLKKIKELALQHDCKIYFLYLPAYGNDLKNSFDSVFYKNFAETIIPPDTILNNFRNWQDEAHFNTRGANALGGWLKKIVIAR